MKKSSEVGEGALFTFYAVIEIFHDLRRARELLVRPVGGEDQVHAQSLVVQFEDGEMPDQFHSDFAHEHADHHIQLVKEGTFLPDSEQPVYDEGHEEHLDGHESDIFKEIEEDPLSVSKKVIVEGIEQHGKDDE